MYVVYFLETLSSKFGMKSKKSHSLLVKVFSSRTDELFPGTQRTATRQTINKIFSFLFRAEVIILT